uniref:Uncharacterized protein n=1 Tax=Anguilla anguilla TaxID=7936 RepID=A0A0E9VWP0_ANGAN
MFLRLFNVPQNGHSNIF